MREYKSENTLRKASERYASELICFFPYIKRGEVHDRRTRRVRGAGSMSPCGELERPASAEPLRGVKRQCTAGYKHAEYYEGSCPIFEVDEGHILFCVGTMHSGRLPTEYSSGSYPIIEAAFRTHRFWYFCRDKSTGNRLSIVWATPISRHFHWGTGGVDPRYKR